MSALLLTLSLSIRIWETPLIDSSSQVAVLPTTFKRSLKPIAERAVSTPLITMSSVTIQTIDEWVKELDEFR